MISGIITTFNRPDAFSRTAPQVARLGIEMLVVDDGSAIPACFQNEEIANQYSMKYLRLPKNRGLAAALNIGLNYWLADAKVNWISYFQDDVDVHADTIEILKRFHDYSPLLTGHDAPEHPAIKATEMYGYQIKIKQFCRATHMHAHVDFLRKIMPIPTNCLGTPKCTAPGVKGMGSNVDWWIVRDSPHSIQKTGKGILCVPHLVRSFLWQPQHSCWFNTAPKGAEPPLLGEKTIERGIA